MWRCVKRQEGLEYWWQASVDTTQHGFSVRWLVGYGVKFEVGRKILEGKKMPCQLGVYKKRNQNPFLRSQSIPRYECKCCDRLISWCVLFKLVVIPSIYTLSGWPLASTYSKIYRFTTPLCQKMITSHFYLSPFIFPPKRSPPTRMHYCTGTNIQHHYHSPSTLQTKEDMPASLRCLLRVSSSLTTGILDGRKRFQWKHECLIDNLLDLSIFTINTWKNCIICMAKNLFS